MTTPAQRPSIPFQRVCVFCAASNGTKPIYREATEETGRELARRKLGLIYGGGKAGLMGAVADAALAEGGHVVGVITKQLMDKELGHTEIAELRIVDTMHERKMAMATLADAFIALPGGLGTLDELFEILAWAQLGIHQKPVGILNVNGFYDGLETLLDHLNEEGFLRLNHKTEIVIDSTPSRLLDRLAATVPGGSRFPVVGR